MWLAVGVSWTKVEVYKFNGSRFVLNQSIELPKWVISMALTNDHLKLAITSYPYLYIYGYNGTKFKLDQRISISSSPFTVISFTSDNQYLTFSEYSHPYIAYVFNSTGSLYQAVENNGDFNRAYKRGVYRLSFGHGKKLLAASTSNGLDLYSNFDYGNAILEQTLDEGFKVTSHDVSKDGTFIITGKKTSYGGSSLQVYMNDKYPRCNIPYCTRCLNLTHCEHCNDLLDYQYNKITGKCSLCNISECVEC